MNHDVLTRAYLRHYAFLMRRYPHQQPTTIYHFAVLAVAALLSLALLALTAIGFWLASHILQTPVVPWNAPKWLILALSAMLVFLPGYFVDKKMEPFRFVGEDLIALYSTQGQRLRWWLTVLSILPLAAVVAACFAVLRIN